MADEEAHKEASEAEAMRDGKIWAASMNLPRRV